MRKHRRNNSKDMPDIKKDTQNIINDQDSTRKQTELKTLISESEVLKCLNQSIQKIQEKTVIMESLSPKKIKPQGFKDQLQEFLEWHQFETEFLCHKICSDSNVINQSENKKQNQDTKINRLRQTRGCLQQRQIENFNIQFVEFQVPLSMKPKQNHIYCP